MLTLYTWGKKGSRGGRGGGRKQSYKGRNDDNESLANLANNFLSIFVLFFNSDMDIVILTAKKVK